MGLTVSQVQTLSPQVIQSLEVLQMNTQELLDYVRELALENPVVEVNPPDVPVAPVRSRSAQQMEWLESTDRQNRWYNRQDNGRDEVREASLGVSTDEPASLAEYVRSQLPAQTGAMARAVRFLTDCLDQNGWIPEGAGTAVGGEPSAASGDGAGPGPDPERGALGGGAGIYRSAC